MIFEIEVGFFVDFFGCGGFVQFVEGVYDFYFVIQGQYYSMQIFIYSVFN